MPKTVRMPESSMAQPVERLIATADGSNEVAGCARHIS
jgi:hypothetical protein